jgi:hypothetical protein
MLESAHVGRVLDDLINVSVVCHLGLFAFKRQHKRILLEWVKLASNIRYHINLVTLLILKLLTRKPIIIVIVILNNNKVDWGGCCFAI